MNNKDKKRQVAAEALRILGVLALLTFICRLWPILLLIILGIFVAAIRLLFLSSKNIEVINPLPQLSVKASKVNENDLRALAYSLILKRITEMVLADYPNARWVWEVSDAQKQIELGEDVYILLNSAGGYRKAKVIIQNLQVIGLQYLAVPKPNGKCETDSEDTTEEPVKENYELIAFEWVESHIFELNARCNEAIGQNQTEIILKASELPIKESWSDVCRELVRAELTDVECVPEGIKIHLTH